MAGSAKRSPSTPRASVAVRCSKIKIFSFPSLSYERFNVPSRRETRIRTPWAPLTPVEQVKICPSWFLCGTQVKQFQMHRAFHCTHTHSQGQRLLPAGEHKPLALLFMEPTAGLSSEAHCTPLPPAAASGTVVSFLHPSGQQP